METFINAQDFMKLPLSKAILYVIEDVKALKGRIDMIRYFDTSLCTVCLGGAALLGRYWKPGSGDCELAIERLGNSETDAILGITYSNTAYIRDTFDCLRCGDVASALRQWSMITTPELLGNTKFEDMAHEIDNYVIRNNIRNYYSISEGRLSDHDETQLIIFLSVVSELLAENDL